MNERSKFISEIFSEDGELATAMKGFMKFSEILKDPRKSEKNLKDIILKGDVVCFRSYVCSTPEQEIIKYKNVCKYYHSDIWEIVLENYQELLPYVRYCKYEDQIRSLALKCNEKQLRDLVETCYFSGFVGGLNVLYEDKRTHSFDVNYMIKNPFEKQIKELSLENDDFD